MFEIAFDCYTDFHLRITEVIMEEIMHRQHLGEIMKKIQDAN